MGLFFCKKYGLTQNSFLGSYISGVHVSKFSTFRKAVNQLSKKVITEEEMIPELARIFRCSTMSIRVRLEREPLADLLEREAQTPEDCAKIIHLDKYSHEGEGANIAIRRAAKLIEAREEAALALVREVMAPETGT